MQKILIIGSPGAGKTTFARRLHAQTGLPLYHLDLLYHRADRTTVPREEFDRKLQAILREDRWMIDGNYQRTIPLRMQYCDTVFWLDFPAEVCLAGAEARVGMQRTDMPWTETEPNPEFMQAIRDFPQKQRPQIVQLLETFRESRRIIVFRSREEADAYTFVGDEPNV